MRSDPTLYPSRCFRWLNHHHRGGPVPILSMEGMYVRYQGVLAAHDDLAFPA